MKKRFLFYEEGIWWAVALGTVIGLLLIIEVDQTGVIGRDWMTIYRPTALANEFISYPLVANPPYIMFLFYPLALLPPLIGYAGIMLVNLLCFRLIANLSTLNKWLVFPSFPALWMFVYGQIDGLVALGVALGAWALRNGKPYHQGGAILLLLLKPHIGAVLAVVYFFWQRDWRRTLLPPVMLLLLSLLIWGITWPWEWIARLLLETGNAAQGAGFNSEANSFNNIGLFPYGLAAWLLLLVPYPRMKKIPGIISAALLSSPYAGAYSLLAAMALPLPVWVYPILSLPLFTAWGYQLIRFAPAAILIWPVVEYYRGGKVSA